jgi:sugar lactone lactonase YvrE
MQHRDDIKPGPWALTGVLATALACGSGGGDNLPDTAPTQLERVADSGFHNAGAVAVSPDGETFYIAAYDEAQTPGVFAVDVTAKTVDPIHLGAPLLYPSDIATSCDGNTLFVADLGVAPTAYDIGGGDKAMPSQEKGGLYTLDPDGGSPATLQASGLLRAAGVVVSDDCDTLYVSGWTDANMPAVFTVPTTGGAAKVLHEGEPLRSPTGIHVDAKNVAWVMDHAARGDQGEGSLFAIDGDGKVKSVASGLGMGRHGGVSLAPGGLTAVIPASNGEGKSFLVTANTSSGEQKIIDAPELQFPTGVAAARNAPVMAVATENAIYSATYE